MSGLDLDLGTARAQWLEHLVRDRRLAKASVATYGSVLHMTFHGLPDSPTELELRAAVDRRLNHASGHVRRGSFVALSQFLAWWERQGGPANLLAEAKSPPKPSARRSALQTADIEALELRLLDARTKDRAEILLMLRAGFRVGDVVSLTVADVDFERARLRCRTGKGGTDTWLPMTDSVAAALREHLIDTGIDAGWVFTGPRGQMRPQAVWKCWRRVAGAELAHYVPHQLRNTFANQLSRGGTNLNSVRRLMRHTSLNTTQRYLDDDEEAERDAVRALDGKRPAEPRLRVLPPPPEPPARPRTAPRTAKPVRRGRRVPWSAAQIAEALRPELRTELGRCGTPEGAVEGWDGLLDWLDDVIGRYPELADTVRPRPFVRFPVRIPAYTYRGLRDALRAGLSGPSPTIDPPDWYGLVEP